MVTTLITFIVLRWLVTLIFRLFKTIHPQPLEVPQLGPFFWMKDNPEQDCTFTRSQKYSYVGTPLAEGIKISVCCSILN